MQVDLVSSAITLAVTILALVLACFYTLRRKYIFAVGCMFCFFMLFNPKIAFGAQVEKLGETHKV